jgi:hypothetical protein
MSRVLMSFTLAVFCWTTAFRAQNGVSAFVAAAPRVPTAVLSRSTSFTLPGTVDSNSPAFWEVENGRPILHVFTSAGKPRMATGTSLQTLGPALETSLTPWPTGANWMEAVVKDSQGVLYGYYHNERNAADLCPGTALGRVQIGAARSADLGKTWEDLGIILEAPRGTEACTTKNKFFVDGVGDFSVQLDPDSGDLYIFFSAYPQQISLQGVGVARFPWAYRDRPAGRVALWNGGAWLPVRTLHLRSSESEPNVLQRLYPPATPFLQAALSWHSENGVVDAFWGPSVHWNTYLQQYVMLLNRAKDADYNEEGIYVAFAPSLDDPRLWSTPVKILTGGAWYPQVMGIEPGTGTDKVAGQTAHFFMKGESSRWITFSK